MELYLCSPYEPSQRRQRKVYLLGLRCSLRNLCMEQGNVHKVLCPVTFVLDGYAGIDIHVRGAGHGHLTLAARLGRWTLSRRLMYEPHNSL
jgi:hypothetical protein